jgi:hypothetical protein
MCVVPTWFVVVRRAGRSRGSGARKRSGRRPMCCAGGSRRTGCRWRSIRIGKRLCAGAECGGAGHGGRAPDAVWPHVRVRVVRHSDHRREFAAGQGTVKRNHGTHQDRRVKKLRRLGIADAPAANAFLETNVSAGAQRRFAQGPLRRPTTLIGGRRVVSRSIACSSSRRRACCPTTGRFATPRGICKWRGRAPRRRLGARCWSVRTRAARLRFAIGNA